MAADKVAHIAELDCGSTKCGFNLGHGNQLVWRGQWPSWRDGTSGTPGTLESVSAFMVCVVDSSGDTLLNRPDFVKEFIGASTTVAAAVVCLAGKDVAATHSASKPRVLSAA